MDGPLATEESKENLAQTSFSLENQCSSVNSRTERVQTYYSYIYAEIVYYNIYNMLL